MWRAALCISAALLFGFPNISHAQYTDSDKQNPREYTDEDSQPLALISYVLYPIGFAAEWLIARPLHYVAHESPLAPVFRPVDGTDTSPPPPVPIIPDNTLSSSTNSSTRHTLDWSPSQAPATTAPNPAPSPTTHYAQPPAGQPAYH